MNFKKRTRRKIVIIFLTLLICILFVGLIFAEKNTRQICFRDEKECLSLNINPQGPSYLKINILGINKNFDISDKYNKIYFFSKKLNRLVSIFI